MSPYINTDQGAQFTSEVFTGTLASHDIAISMDGKGRWLDNVFVERLWRSVKYEDVYLRALRDPSRTMDLPRFSGQFMAVTSSPELGDSRWT